jgi:hypothetical protein
MNDNLQKGVLIQILINTAIECKIVRFIPSDSAKLADILSTL